MGVYSYYMGVLSYHMGVLSYHMDMCGVTYFIFGWWKDFPQVWPGTSEDENLYLKHFKMKQGNFLSKCSFLLIFSKKN